MTDPPHLRLVRSPSGKFRQALLLHERSLFQCALALSTARRSSFRDRPPVLGLRVSPAHSARHEQGQQGAAAEESGGLASTSSLETLVTRL